MRRSYLAAGVAAISIAAGTAASLVGHEKIDSQVPRLIERGQDIPEWLVYVPRGREKILNHYLIDMKRNFVEASLGRSTSGFDRAIWFARQYLPNRECDVYDRVVNFLESDVLSSNNDETVAEFYRNERTIECQE